MKRRTFIKRLLAGIVSIFGLGGGTYYYAREMEPKMLEVHRIAIESSKIPNNFDSLKILQFSDTHIGFHYTVEQLQKLVQKINALNPDIITFTGDLVDNPQTYKWNNDIPNILNQLSARHGKFWVYGNHDHGGYGTDIVKQTFDQADFQLLLNNNHIIERNGEKIMIAG